MNEQETKFEFDVCLSFAGEQRDYIEEVAQYLRELGIRPFYDDYEKITLWGKDLYEHLDWVYRKASQLCIMFISKDYANKVWTSHERKSAQSRAMFESSEYVLPVRFDETEIPGLPPTIGYLEASSTPASELARLIVSKLGPRIRKSYLPPKLDVLYRHLNLTKKVEKNAASLVAATFFHDLRRMSIEERRLIAYIFYGGCPAELPSNVHISLDVIRRTLGHSPAETMQMLKGMSSIGFKTKLRTDSAEGDDIVVVIWQDRASYYSHLELNFAAKYSTLVARTMLVVCQEGMCEEHGQEAVDRIDFSALSKATARTIC